MIPQDFIQGLLGRVDIVDVVDRYVKLKKSGANYSACCPFHNEKTPSFTVSPSKQFYHCFGCGAHGNAIGFLMEYSGLPYPDAIRSLAEGLGLTVPEVRSDRERAKEEKSPALTALMMDALNYYRAQLKKSPQAVEYLKGRGLSGEIAARFGLGYAPEGWQNLAAVFTDYQGEALKDTGLVIDSDPAATDAAGRPKESRRYDRFRGRVMFPILDSRGNVIGFGGRIIGEGEPKYLNSPETPLFEKGRELYGLYQARRAIREANQVVVVEGYMDVVALAQHGVENAVATLGTATTPFHVTKLLRLADDVVFCFDGDAAGRKAAWRALEVSLPVLMDGKAVRFLFLPQEDDPDTFVRRLGKEAFARALAEAKPLSQFLVGELSAQVDMRSEEGRAKFIALARPLLGRIEAPALAAMLRHRIRELCGLSESEAAELLPGSATRSIPGPPPARGTRRARSLELRLLARVLAEPPLAAGVVPEAMARSGAEAAALAAVVEFLRGAAPGATLAQVSAYFEGGEHHAVIEEALNESLLRQAEGPGLDLQAEVTDLVDKLRAEHQGRRHAELLRRLDAGEASAAERAEYHELHRQLAAAKSGNLTPESRSKL
jgi:DNA primase